jgi:WD40-like Beta Propeller Repeat
MKTAKSFFKWIANIILLSILVLGLVVLFNSISKYSASTSTPQTSPAQNQAYPPPKSPTATTLQPLLETPVHEENQAYPAPLTPWPTFTPFPSPTLRPGPTQTPIPLVGPAKDAAGEVYYFSLDTSGNTSVSKLEVDATGMGLIEPITVTNKKAPNPGGTVYYSPNGKLAAAIGGWGTGNLIDLQSGAVEPFSIPNFDNFYNWFADGHRVLGRGLGGELNLADPISGEFNSLAVPGYNSIDGAASSPDGMKVVYAKGKGFSDSEIWFADSEGRNARKAFDLPVHASLFAWSPDDKRIAFWGLGLMVMNSDGSDPHTVSTLALPSCYDLPPQWSPDSRTLAIVNVPAEGSFCGGWDEAVFKGTNIFLVDVENGKSWPLLTDGSSGNIDPAWSPDGTRIAFVSNRSGASEIWVASIDGKEVHQITNSRNYLRFPFWAKP